MSCDIINDNNYDFLLSVLQTRCESSLTLGEERLQVREGNSYGKAEFKANLSKIGEAMKAMNYASVNARYNENTKHDAYTFKFIHDGKDRVITALKLLDYYEYQSCEASDYYDSAIHAFINDARKILVRGLSGYNDAPWGL